MYRISLFIYLRPITFIAQAIQAVITLDKRLVSAGGQTDFRDVGGYQRRVEEYGLRPMLKLGLTLFN